MEAMSMITKAEATTRYHVRVVGHIWQPGVGPCATEVVVSEPMTLPQASGEYDRDYLVRMIQCAADHKLGDFSSIDAWEIEVEEYRASTNMDIETGERTRNVSTVMRMLVEFDDEHRDQYFDAMFGGE